MPLSVIGAGVGRTGTASLKLALEQLGFSPCHHMMDVIQSPTLPKLWERAFDGELGDWEEIFKDFRASVDAPSCYFYRELADRYPDAKVILTVRDPERWFESAEATIFQARHQMMLSELPVGPMIAKMIANEGKRAGIPLDVYSRGTHRDAMIQRFINHNEEVRRTIPKERLLVFEAKEGWEPLCAFLGVPVPDMPYPRTNDTAQFHSRQADFLKGSGG